MKDSNLRTINRDKKLLSASMLLRAGVISPLFLVAQAQQGQVKKPAVATIAAVAGSSGQPSGYSVSHAEGSEQVLHVVVGRSIFVNTQSRLRRVYVANPAVLESYTSDPNQIVVTAKTPGISTLVLWDESGQSKAYLVSSDINVEQLQLAFKESLPLESIHVEGNENRVLLSGTVTSPLIADAAFKLASLYAKDVANSLVVNSSKIKQVRLKVRIVEIDRSKLDQFGVNFFSQGGSTVAGTTTSQFPSNAVVSVPQATTGGGSFSTLTVSDPLNFLLYSSKLNVGATVKDLENKQILQILAEPTITTLNGQKADFLAGGEFPFPVVQGGSGGLNSISVQFRPYGVKLEFTPNVNADGSIELKVAPEVSALDYANAAVISGYTIPALSTRRAETQVVLKSGQSFAISGLLDRRTTDALGRTPGIASIPILGQLFKSKSLTHSVNELIVIVTPTVVDPMSDTSIPEEPKLVVPMIDPLKFDPTVVKKKKGQ